MNLIKCNKSDCFQNYCGTSCRLLNAPITDHACPFYKTEAEVDNGRIEAHNKLLEKGRKDLIEQYEYNPYRRGSW